MLGVLFSILAGAAMSIQGVMNTRLGERIGTMEANAFVQCGAAVLSLAAKLIALGCRYAVNFDGGGSAQCTTPAGEVKSARVVHTLFWLRHAASDAPPALKRGDRGRAVKSLQTLLASWGQSCGWYGADGDFGPDTANAVLRFQRVKGLKPTGEADAKTWKTLIGGRGV